MVKTERTRFDFSANVREYCLLPFHISIRNLDRYRLPRKSLDSIIQQIYIRDFLSVSRGLDIANRSPGSCLCRHSLGVKGLHGGSRNTYTMVVAVLYRAAMTTRCRVAYVLFSVVFVSFWSLSTDCVPPVMRHFMACSLSFWSEESSETTKVDSTRVILLRSRPFLVWFISSS